MILPYTKRKTKQLVDICRNLSIDTTNNRVGIGSTIPITTLDISGDVKSTEITTSNVALTSTSSATDISDSFDFTTPFAGNVTASAFVGFGTGLTGV